MHALLERAIAVPLKAKKATLIKELHADDSYTREISAEYMKQSHSAVDTTVTHRKISELQ